MTRYWTQAEAVTLARYLETRAPHCGAHVALTGGCLYGNGPRKDVDIVVYRIRQRERIDREQFFLDVGAEVIKDTGFVVKTRIDGRAVDFLFPEAKEGDYAR